MKIIYVNCGVDNYLKEDHRSCIRNLCSCEKKARLQNSPQFCVFKYARAVKQNVRNEAKNRRRELYMLRHTLPFRFLILRKKLTVLQSKRKPKKNSGFYGIRILDLCDTDAVLYQLS